MNWIKKQFPGTFQFFVDFFDGLNNRPNGHSLRKLLAIGFFWLNAVLCIRYTNENNLVVVIGILTGMITALVITYTVGNYKDRGLEQSGKSPESPIQEEKR